MERLRGFYSKHVYLYVLALKLSHREKKKNSPSCEELSSRGGESVARGSAAQSSGALYARLYAAPLKSSPLSSAGLSTSGMEAQNVELSLLQCESAAHSE